MLSALVPVKVTVVGPPSGPLDVIVADLLSAATATVRRLASKPAAVMTGLAGLPALSFGLKLTVSNCESPRETAPRSIFLLLCLRLFLRCAECSPESHRVC